MTTTLKIDFVSEVSCPWCAVGLGALEQALARLGSDVQAELPPAAAEEWFAPALADHAAGLAREQTARLRALLAG